jgi:pimeloyl-ACP methyl ester carboxylesterase
MQAATPNAQLVVIEGAAHGSSLERPDDVNKAILDWAGQQAALGARQVG